MRLLINIALFLIPFFSFSQNSRLRYADKLYENQSYPAAIEAYLDVLERTDDSLMIAQIANAYYQIGNDFEASRWYSVKMKSQKMESVEYTQYFLSLRRLKEYSKSLVILEKYQQIYGETPLTQRYLINPDTLTVLDAQNVNFEIKEENALNSEYSDIGVSRLDNSSYLMASAKRSNMISNKVDARTGQYFYDFYSFTSEAGTYSKLQRENKGLKSKEHDALSSFCIRGDKVYFTRNFKTKKSEKDAGNSINLRVMRGDWDGKKIVNVEELSFNSNDYSCQHPFVSEKGDLLFFSSDKPNGKGGFDLYYCQIDTVSGKVGEVISLQLNTSENDVFPYYNDKDRLLFFSSNGHVGYGGLDVFVAFLDKQLGIKSIRNLGQPINSNLDDLTFSSTSDQKSGYFASERVEGAGGSDDIYSFIQLEPFVNRKVLDLRMIDFTTNDLIPNVIFNITDQNGNVLGQFQATEEGQINIDVEDFPDSIQLNVAHNGYFSLIHPIHYPADKEYHCDSVKLIPTINYHLAGSVYDKETNEKIPGSEVSIKNQMGRVVFKGKTSELGTFSSETIEGIRYGDSLIYNIELSKPGYISNTFLFAYRVDLTQEIQIDNYLRLEVQELKLGVDLGEVVKIEPIYFDFDKFDIRPDAEIELNKILKILNQNPGISIELGSHTDSRGSASYNRKLSSQRAKSSMQYLVNKGIAPNRITYKGYGEDMPRARDAEINKQKSNEVEFERLHQLNRRTEFIITKVDGSMLKSSEDLINDNTNNSTIDNERTNVSIGTGHNQKVVNGVNMDGWKENVENIKNGFYIVQPGETLYRVSVNSGVSVNELKKINKLKSNGVVPGTRLNIE